jgi:hypothetical protein
MMYRGIENAGRSFETKEMSWEENHRGFLVPADDVAFLCEHFPALCVVTTNDDENSTGEANFVGGPEAMKHVKAPLPGKNSAAIAVRENRRHLPDARNRCVKIRAIRLKPGCIGDYHELA